MRNRLLDSVALTVLLLGIACSTPALAATIVIDGVNDFSPADTHATSTAGYTGYATQDGTDLFLGFSGAGLFSAPSTTWLVAYVGTGAAGTTSGLNFNTQQPLLGFSASHVLRWRLDGAVQDVQVFNGASWVLSGVAVSSAQSGGYLEAAIPLAPLGSPTTLELAAYLLSDQTGNEWSYAALPSSAFTDSYDPNLGAHLTFAVPEPGTALLLGLGLAGLAAGRRRRRRTIVR